MCHSQNGFQRLGMRTQTRTEHHFAHAVQMRRIKRAAMRSHIGVFFLEYGQLRRDLA